MPSPSSAARPVGAPGGSGVRRVVTVAGIAFLAGIAFHAFLGADGSSRTTPPPAVMPGAPSGQQAPGPSKIVEGVPAGFPATEAGAVAAASAFVTTGQALINMDPLAAEQAVRQVAAASSADRQVETVLSDLRGLRQTLREGTGPVVFRQASIAARVVRSDAARARVAVWNVGILSRSGVASPQATWQVSTFDLVWERGDWRVEGETVSPGPAPTLDDSAVPATSAQFASGLEGFRPLVVAEAMAEAGR